MNESTVSTLKRFNGEAYMLRILTNFKPSAMVLDEHESTTCETGLILISNEQGPLTESGPQPAWLNAKAQGTSSPSAFRRIGTYEGHMVTPTHEQLQRITLL